MSEVQKCLSVFAVASIANHCRSIAMADAAIDVYLTPHLREGTAKPALQALLRAFSKVRKDSAFAYAIRTDLEGRLSRLPEPTAPTTTARTDDGHHEPERRVATSA